MGTFWEMVWFMYFNNEKVTADFVMPKVGYITNTNFSMEILKL